MVKINKHSCVTIRGKAADCRACIIYQHNYCIEFVGILEKLPNRRNISGLLPEIIEDIISDTVEGTQKYFKNYIVSGVTSSSHFARWVNKIFNGKRADYFRKIYPSDEGAGKYSEKIFNEEYEDDKSYSGSQSCSPEYDTKIDAERIIEALESMINKDRTRCVKLFLDCYYFNKEDDLSDKDLAMKLGLIPNTFSIKKKRCRKIVLELLKGRNML